jgi:protein AFG1
MTSAAYARDEVWRPLSAAAREWEAASAAPAPATRAPPPDAFAPAGDYAGEAAYEDAARAPPRPDAPRLREHHVWGVREDWGKKAGAWGQGAKVHEEGPKSGS